MTDTVCLWTYSRLLAKTALLWCALPSGGFYRRNWTPPVLFCMN